MGGARKADTSYMSMRTSNVADTSCAACQLRAHYVTWCFSCKHAEDLKARIHFKSSLSHSCSSWFPLLAVQGHVFEERLETQLLSYYEISGLLCS